MTHSFLRQLIAACTTLLFFLFLPFNSFSQSYNMSTGTVTTCSGTFYDNGGPTGNYSNAVTYTQTFVSATGSRLKFDFTSMSSLNAASLRVYDGPTDAYPLIGTFGGATFSVQSTGTSLTFVFNSPSGVWTTYAGWEAAISCTTPTLTPYPMSSGTVTTCSGVFFDPAGPAANYPNSNTTVQTFSSGSSSYLQFVFGSFDVQAGDTLWAYDGSSTAAPLIGAYTGNILPETISSLSGSNLTFKFVSNSTGNSSGWKAEINCTAAPAPGSLFNMQAGIRYVCGGTFFDNGGPTRDYSTNVTYTQTFVSSTGSRLKFNFTSMSNLNSASLRIYDGPTDAYPLIGTFGGSTFSVQSTGTSLTFVFNSPSGVWTTYPGWEAAISCTTPTLTPYPMSSGTVTACSGVFFDPAGPAANYPNSNTTVQTFSSGSSSYLQFAFSNFDVPAGDTLWAYDGSSTAAPLIGAYTGNSLPENIASLSGSSLTFKFVSNSTGNSSGWKAEINCTTTPAPGSLFNMQAGIRYVCGGTFFDNGGPTRDYSVNVNYTQTFVSSTGSRLKFNFIAMSNLNSVSLRIYDGPSAAYPLIGTFGGSTFSVQSTGTSLTFVFNSPSGVWTTYAGWEAAISCTTPTLTPYPMSSGTVTACSGVFFDPAGPTANYPNSNTTVQTFNSGSSSYLQFVFSNFDVQAGDTLWAYDGATTAAPLLGAYTGNSLPENIASLSGSSLTFKFVSNSTGNSSGWKAEINCTATPSPGSLFNMQAGIRYVCSGTFFDNGGPTRDYSVNVNYTQTFVSSTGSRLRFNFTSMSNLNSASFSIYDGPSAAYPLIGTFGGSTFSVQSTGTSLTFVFNSPSGVWTTYAGWEAAISCTTPTLTPYPMSSGTVTACSGVFFDPAGPAANYPNSNTTIQTFNSGAASYLQFVFYNFNVQAGDTLWAYDGSTTAAPLIGAYTGNALPENIASMNGSSLTFKFVSNSTGNSSGWKAEINCTPAPAPGTAFNMQSGIRYVCSGSFFDNGGPTRDYSNGINNTQTFVSSTGSRLKFNFTSMSNLNAATLKIYDGPSAASPLIGTFGGATFSVQSTGTSLTFVFNSPSGVWTTYAGWEATISCIAAPASPVASFTTSSGTVCAGSCLSFTDQSTNTPTAWNWQFQGASVATATVQHPSTVCYSSPGTYTVSLTASNNTGTSTATGTIVVLPLPVVSITASSSSVCAGNSATLTASGAATYTWSSAALTSSLVVTPGSTSTYSITGTHTNGCRAGATSTLTVFSLPVLSIASTNTLLCSGQSATLSATGAATYSWSQGGNTPAVAIAPVSTTTYTVTGYDTHGCAGTQTFVQQVGVCTGIETVTKNDMEINVYPNPFSETVFVELKADAQITILNSIGQIMRSLLLQAGIRQLDTRDLPAGIYYVSIKAEHIIVKKLVKE